MPTGITDDVRIDEIDPLMSPLLLIKELPLEEKSAATIVNARESVAAALRGEDDRLVTVVGPCSIHDPEAALEYADRLKVLIDRYADDLIMIMRVYFEKPRTTIGWKGLINDPDLDGSFDINKGLRTARKLLCDLTHRGVPAGHEFLDTISPQYIADLISWGAIGARTTESQMHRELASGLSMPVGFKNGTGGGVKIAVDAIRAAAHSHSFLSVTKHGVSAIVRTHGNKDCHVILRGSSGAPNYDAKSIADCVTQLEGGQLPPCVMVDCSHGNSEKKFENQPKVSAHLAEQVASGSRAISGVMIESHLREGNQKPATLDKLEYGKSITDACVSWETTETMLEELARAVQKRRG